MKNGFEKITLDFDIYFKISSGGLENKFFSLTLKKFKFSQFFKRQPNNLN